MSTASTPPCGGPYFHLAAVQRLDQTQGHSADRVLCPHWHGAGRTRYAQLDAGAAGGGGLSGHLVGGRCRSRFQLRGGAAHRCQDEAHRLAATAKGELTNTQTLAFSATLCAIGSAILYVLVNPLTMWLTFATFVGYAVIYTVVLKPLTPQNIVIGGASGAMPPVLGWAAMIGDVGPEAAILFLIIFLWTPPHFWALALYRVEDYRKSGLPMLPVTHGSSSPGCKFCCTPSFCWQPV